MISSTGGGCAEKVTLLRFSSKLVMKTTSCVGMDKGQDTVSLSKAPAGENLHTKLQGDQLSDDVLCCKLEWGWIFFN